MLNCFSKAFLTGRFSFETFRQIPADRWKRLSVYLIGSSTKESPENTVQTCRRTRWSVARAFSCAPSKTKSSRTKTEVECTKCNETWQASKLINYLFIGVYFIPCDCHCDVIYGVYISHPKKNSGTK